MTEPVHGEYDDAALYDAENGWGPDDDFYRALAAETGGPVLDLACGTGRLARALAADGHRVVGLDLSPAMIARARHLDAGRAVDWHVGDATDFAFDTRFRLIVMTAHAFQHLIGATAQGALFARVARHLAPDGLFAFETRPGRQDYADGAGFKLWHRFSDPVRGPVEVWAAAAFDTATGVDHVTLVRRFTASGAERRSEALLQFTDAATLDARLAAAGLACQRRYGDFGREAFGPDSPEIVTIAALR